MKNKIESIDYSGMICYPDKEKPTYKGFEPKENKVIFESEEEFKSWWFKCGIGIIGCHEYNVIKRRCVEHGYIRKSPVEEAEEYIRHVEKIMDGMTTPSPKDLEYSIRIVEKLKSEIERLKN